MNNKQRVLFVVLAIIGVLLTLNINGALATEKTKPLKCSYAFMTPGAFEVPGKGFGEFLLGAPIVITVLETKDSPSMNEEGKESTMKMHRFSATYDKPILLNMCPQHGPEIMEYEMYSQIFPPEALENFLLPVNLAVECK